MTREDRIVNGDCVQELAKLDEGSVDLAFADPPFNIGYDYDVYDDRRKAEEYLDWSRGWIEAVHRVLKPDGTFWLAIGDEFAAELKVLATRDVGFHCRNWVVWFYTFGVHCKNKFTRSHAHLFYFVKDPKLFTFNSLDVRVPSARELVYGDKRADPAGRVPDDTWMMTPILPPEVPTRDGFTLRPQDIPDRFPATSDTWFFSRVAGTFNERRGWHGCQMPEQLLGRIIRACSNEGDLVVDPFAGSGTTLAVAKKLGRRFLGFEISKEYVRNIQQRLAAIHHGDALVGPENAAKSAPRTSNGRRLARSGQSAKPKARPGPRNGKSHVEPGEGEGANDELATEVARAFVEAHQGHSSDRVLADPALNELYLENCRLLQIPGDATTWNHLLLRARKAGRLSAIKTTRRTMIRWTMMEEYLHASEIAWRKLSDKYSCSLDDILCDPLLAGLFDGYAKQIAPGYEPLQYRWAALRLRKDASEGKDILDKISNRMASDLTPLRAAHRLPGRAGHYLLMAENKRFFVGFTNSLRECSFFQQDHVQAALNLLGQGIRDSEIQIRRRNFDPSRIRKAAFDVDTHEYRFAQRAKLLDHFKPLGNVPVPSAA